MAQRRKKKVAVVQCYGGCTTKEKAPLKERRGNCEQILAFSPEEVSDTPECRWGCLGGGSCVEACRLGAVRINSRGIAEVDWEKCVGCGLCVKACPRKLIRLTYPEFNIYPACVNEDPGAQTRKECETGCIACGICVKNCPADAVSIQDDHAVIDEEKCIFCGMCAVKCPWGTIRDYNGIFTVREEQE